MFLEDASPSSQWKPRSQANTNPIEDTPADPSCKAGEGINTVPFFSVTGKITLKPMAVTPERGVGHLPPGVARLVSLAGLSAVLLAPLSGCGSVSDVPCPIPTPSSSGTAVSNGASTARCTTSDGTHYLWIHNRGGWVPSDDGIHPRSNATGVGVDDTHSGASSDGHSGVGGDGHSGSSSGGGEGG